MKHKLKPEVMLNKEMIDQLGKAKKEEHGRHGLELTYVQQQSLMPSRCAENSAAEEGFQYPLFK